MSSYFSLPAFAHAKKNKDELQKRNPQKPVLQDEDEKFLERQIAQDQTSRLAKDVETTKISDEGDEKAVSSQERRSVPEEQVVVPETQPESSTSPTTEKKGKKHKDMELPSQEEAEAATRGWNEQVHRDEHGNTVAPEKRTWASYLPSSLKPAARQGDVAEQLQKPVDTTMNPPVQPRQTWAEYATSYVPDSWKKAFSKDPDSQAEPVYNDDGTINEAATKEKQEREISVLLDNLNMSSINNRVFALSDSTHDIYSRFSVVLKDTINGGPTAYEDMEKLMREAGPQLEKQFQSMPPFVQTLVKSLPAKIGTAMAPELMAVASEKPGHDMSERLKAASAGKGFGGASKAAAGKATEDAGKTKTKKNTRRIPGLKSLISKEGAVATILRNTVTFLQTRFPFLASGTNVVMSLAVFILMFVFWYCHKRGKEVRLAKEAEASSSQKDGAAEDSEGVDDDIEDEDSDEGDETVGLEDKLQQADPKDVPLPEEGKGERKRE